MTLYRLAHAPHLGTFASATAAIVAGLLAGLSGHRLDWIAVASPTA